MAGTPTSLARRYRRLLMCYPRAYRRQRGDEIVGTLLELAPPGRVHPSAREAANLIRHGLRTRLGRPASRSVVAWSLLTALACGLFAASAASWAAWWTARPLHGAEARAVFTELLPALPLAEHASPDPASVFIIYGEPLSLRNADDLLLGDGGEYSLAAIGSSLMGDQTPAGQRAVAPLIERLRAGGWSFGDPIVRNAVDCADSRCDPATLPTETYVYAGRDDQQVSIVIYPSARSDESAIGITLARATPPAVVPAGAVAGLLGAVLGWLLFAWASRRTEHRHAALRATAKVCFSGLAFLWWLPIVLAAPQMLAHHLGEWHYSWHPLWEWLGQPALSLPFLAGSALGLCALAIAALPRRDPRPTRDVAVG